METGQFGENGVFVQMIVVLAIKQGWETVLILSLYTEALVVKAKKRRRNSVEIWKKNVVDYPVVKNMSFLAITVSCIQSMKKPRQFQNVASIWCGKGVSQNVAL